MQRVTVQHLQSKVDIVNRALGFDPEAVQYNTVGAVVLSGAYGGRDVHRVVSSSGAVTSLMGGHGPAKDAAVFLSGMIAALRLARDTRSNIAANEANR